MAQPLFYRKEPLFGLDIGHGNIKVVELEHKNNRYLVNGYGRANFLDSTMDNGVITDPKKVAKAVFELLTDTVIGGIDTTRIATSIPVAQSFTRMLTLHNMSDDELRSAVQLEAEQYIPLPLEDLYLDYESYPSLSDEEDEIDVLMVAVPRKIVDSYMELFNMLNLEVALIETSLISSVRGVRHSLSGSLEDDAPPTLLVDFGARSCDLSIFDQSIRVTGTVDKGGDDITAAIAKGMKITNSKANTLKIRHGIDDKGQHQAALMKAISPVLDGLIHEVKKIERYYSSRASGGDKTIENMIILGGGANLPGLDAYLSKESGLTTTICNPWKNIDFNQLQEPHSIETTSFTTAVGLALAGEEAHYD